MEKLLAKIGIKGNLRKNFAAILIIACSGMIIYGLPYFRLDYYDAYVATYNLTDIQMGLLGSVYGAFGMISYLFGGVLADRVPTRVLLTLSMVGTGAGGFVHLLPLPYPVLVGLYAFWGFSSLFAFWPACVKATRIMSDKDDQGKAFGLFEGGRGICSAIVTMLVVVVFRIGVGSLGEDTLDGQIAGMRAIIIFYSVLTVLFGIFIWIKMDKTETMEQSDRVSFKDIGSVIRMPAVWIIAIVTLCNYMYCVSLYYFVPYSTAFLGLSISGAAAVSALKKWTAPVSNIGGGFLGDKMGTSNLLFTSFVAVIIGTVLILVLPIGTASLPIMILFIVLYIGSYIFFQVNYSLTWAMMEEGAVPKKVSGTAAGFISTIGYLPDVFVSLLFGFLVSGGEEEATAANLTGYRTFFIILVIALAIGAIFTLIWKNYLKKKGILKSAKKNG
ncbi:MAG TPA: MFS transporter [Candidatus Scybalocola faecipullorum]|nr:MFS transporter [Candidatus Scybalocola faecipullorum]